MNLKLKDNPKLRLSVGITQLEYIQSTGTQYIDTGIKLNQNSRVVYEFNDLNNSAAFIFGSRNAASNAEFGYISGTSDDQGVRYGNQNKALAIQHNTRLVLDANKNNWSLNNTQVTLLTTTFQSNYNCILFGFNDGGNISKVAVRVFSCKIYDNDTLVRNLIPCITDLDTPGMYDIVSQTFFYNQGTGNFVAGTDIGSTSYFAEKITTLYHKNCPHIDGYTLLKSIQLAQSSLPAQKLNRVRVDIGNVSGSYYELMQYSTLGGFNDNYESQTKPRFVGTWTINDWYLPSQLSAAQAAFDGLTVIGNSNYLIKFNDLAVQTLDPNEDNYNPAVAIILQGENKGVTMTNAPLGYGRWFLTKSQAAAITTFQKSNKLSIFRSVSTVTDANGIVSSDTTVTYDFEYFNELVYFTGFSQIYQYCFLHCKKLKEVDLSNHKLHIETFNGCTSLRKVVLNSNETQIPNKCFTDCSELEIINLPSTIRYIGQEAFEHCGKNKDLDLNLPSLTGSTGSHPFFKSSLIREVINLGTLTTIVYYGFSRSSCTKVTLPATLTTMTGEIFAFCPNLVFVHLLSETPPSASSDCFKSTTTGYKIYVGDGSSAAHDDAILADYQAASGWSSYISRLDTWYNYLHPQS